MGVLVVIPARGGSKGVPRKNVRLLAGRPLIAYSIAAAASAPSVTRIVVSTDDDEIMEVSRKWGAEVPFRRPAGLAGDSSPMLPVLIHALDWFERTAGGCEAVVLLQPTSPFRPDGMVERALGILRDGKAEVVLGLCRAKHHPAWMKVVENGEVRPLLAGSDLPTRRQDLPAAYCLSGSIYVWTRPALLRRADAGGATQFPDERVLPLVVEGIDALDIDTEADFRYAEMLALEHPERLPKPRL